MKKLISLICMLYFAIGAIAQSSRSSSLAETSAVFQKNVNDGKMTFVKPEGTVEIPIIKGLGVHYEYALKLKDKNVEIRYSVWPLTKDFFDAYDKREKTPGDTIWNPNKLHNTMPALAYSKISEGKLTPGQVRLKNFSTIAVKNDFGAEEGAMFIGPVGPTFGQKYTWGMFTVIHKDYAADAYIFYLFESQEDLFKIFGELSANPAFTRALTFKR